MRTEKNTFKCSIKLQKYTNLMFSELKVYQIHLKIDQKSSNTMRMSSRQICEFSSDALPVAWQQTSRLISSAYLTACEKEITNTPSVNLHSLLDKYSDSGFLICPRYYNTSKTSELRGEMSNTVEVKMVTTQHLDACSQSNFVGG
ncbi:hypothetical protein F2P81_025285 [Scophthalmus maximus]|uniref:Uncharacterized protein n=1 Tax=Scophthalmus maximus TaxID=52904 RepID=A0A6A4RTX6_SCOMX|nr:hypothetical protein F2P81_025285 [Scophthalmus maximus]